MSVVNVFKNVLRKRRVLFIFFILLESIILLLFTFNIWVNVFNIAAGKIDDWQFVQPTSTYSYNFFDHLAYIFTEPKIIALLLIYLQLFILFFSSLIYILYRFNGFIIRIFKKEIPFGTKKGLIRAFGGLLLGILLLGLSTYFAFQEKILVETATMLVTLFFIIPIFIFLITLLYFTLLLVGWLFFGYKFKSYTDYYHKVAFVLAGLGFGTIFIIYIIVSIVSGLFGIEVTNMALPKFGGESEIGYSTGGSKDVNNFRENIKNNYLPIPTDMKYEGLFYDYYFDTGQKQPCSELFCPSFSYALSRDPFSQKSEQYMSVGLNSGIKKTDFHRKKLNLVVVLDISGSMGSPFDSYYYDQFGNQQQKDTTADNNKKKIQIASEAVTAMLDHLTPDDRFGMVLFDENAYLAKPIRSVKETNMEAIKQHILGLKEQGSTNMEAGLTEGAKMLKEYSGADHNEYENRMIFLTDAQPNTGDYSQGGLLDITQKNAQNFIFTTFIGIGVDFNTELIDSISKINGANYYSVHSSEEFKQRMDNGFEYMVTPLVFDLSLRFESPDYYIGKVYGSPESNVAVNEIMKINTLFPSDRVEEQVKGGLVLLLLKKKSDISAGNNINLVVSYKDRNGKMYANSIPAIVPAGKEDYFENSGIRKGIVLSRYADLMIGWAINEGYEQTSGKFGYEPVSSESGIVIPQDPFLTHWERKSMLLRVSPMYKDVFSRFKEYFMTEKQAIGDEALQQEISLLDKLINY